jgi:trehalose 6-phosphate synthase/phosphatase
LPTPSLTPWTGAGGSAAVWFQDYHLALAPGRVRSLRPDLSLAHFWHIPFPPLEIFRIASEGEALLRGLLANDVMGFHLPLFCDNFLRCAESVVPGVQVDWQARSAELDGHRCNVRAFPISIDIDAVRDAATAPGSGSGSSGCARATHRTARSSGWVWTEWTTRRGWRKS